MEISQRKIVPAISPDTLTIIGMFRALDGPDKIVTKQEMRDAIGRDPTGLLHTAMRHMLRDYNVVIEYDRIKGGWRNMLGADNLQGRKKGMAALRRKARRENDKLSTIDFAKLTDSEKLETCAVASICGAITHLSTASGVKRIESAIQKADSSGLPIGKTLALFHDPEIPKSKERRDECRESRVKRKAEPRTPEPPNPQIPSP